MPLQVILVKPCPVIYLSGTIDDLMRMPAPYKTIYEVRLENLGIVLAKVYGGVQSRLAEALGCSPAQIIRLQSDTVTRRNIGDKMARDIERAAGMPHGWMDAPHDDLEELHAKLQRLDSRNVAAIDAMIRSLLQSQD